METVTAPMANNTVVVEATALAGDNASNHQMLPAEAASYIAT